MHDGRFKKGEHRFFKGEFKKGNIPWDINVKIDRKQYPKMGHFVKHSKETKRKMSDYRKGKPSSMGMLGKKHSEKWKKETSLRMLGNKNSVGREYSVETRKKKSISMMGKNTKNGGITPINLKIRGSLEYRLWRKSVFERDNYTCVWCGKSDCYLEADHIKPFAYYPELRFAIDNGRTLCRECHKTTDTYGFKVLKYVKY